jgi:hypothetical protein
MSDETLRQDLLKLASEKPEVRALLLPVLRKHASATPMTNRELGNSLLHSIDRITNEVEIPRAKANVLYNGSSGDDTTQEIYELVSKGRKPSRDMVEKAIDELQTRDEDDEASRAAFDVLQDALVHRRAGAQGN